jgi:hypothetical protein
MNKLIPAFIAGAFAFVTASALAQTPAAKPKPATQPIQSEGDLTPLSKMDTEQAKAARAAAKAKWDAMTPEEKAAAKKAIAKKRQQDLTAIDELVAKGEGVPYDAKKGAAEAAASKAQPTPSKTERQKALTDAEKASHSKSGVPMQ